MKARLFPLFLLVAILASGCYWNADVATDQVGAKLDENAVKECVGPGVYSEGGWFTDLKTISVGTITFEVEDPEVATKDNQLVGVKITIQARRDVYGTTADGKKVIDCDKVRGMLANWSQLLDNAALQDTIDATAREGIKNGTRQFTLTDLLDDRNKLADGISEPLKNDAAKYYAEIVNVTIENVAIAPEYAAVLQATAKLKADEDFQLRRKALIQQTASTDLFERQQQQLVLAEQLKVEEAKTDVEVEIARREGEKIKAEKQVYVDNPQAFQLEQLRLLKELFGEGTVYFIPEGTDLTTFFNLQGLPSQVVPVPQTTP